MSTKSKKNKPTRPTVAIQGINLRRRDDYVEVLVWIDGEWRLVISELHDSYFDHASYAVKIKKAPLDPLYG